MSLWDEIVNVFYVSGDVAEFPCVKVGTTLDAILISSCPRLCLAIFILHEHALSPSE
jgi:hypothetical protein